MRTNHMKLESLETFVAKLACGFASILLLLLLGTLLVCGFAMSSAAETGKPKTFASPGEAASALFGAAQKDDEQAVEAILGAGRDVASSGDEEEDKLEHEQFTKKYQEMHRLVREPDGRTVLYIGAENWPFPIPLVSKNGVWYFDSETGKQEIQFRTIGENEATAIQVCEEFAMAKHGDDVKADSEDPITRLAETLVSAGVANADKKDPTLFQGYYFQVIQNPAGVSDSKKAKGLTLVAYPAEYRKSGVMTFVVAHHGIVHQKDLGPNTTTIAPRIKAGTGPSWHPVA